MILLDYANDLMLVASELAGAKDLAVEVTTLLQNENDTYYGTASESMVLFATQLTLQLGKLQMFYGKASQYAANCFEALNERDEALAAWLIKNTEMGG